MKILVDADACPVKEIIVRQAKKRGIPVVMLLDTSHILNDGYSKVITVDKSAVEYYRKLSELTAQIHKIGVLYNQTVRAINSYHSVRTAQILLEKLEKISGQIITLQQKAIQLTEQFDSR